ncbi:MAG: PH domain-containing protein [Thermoplasmata archaeon]|nr:PH domain-containing protein [Thermoplasmata archaeon]
MSAQFAAPASPFGQTPSAALPGSFPREYIGTGETVIYETRPSLVPYILGGIAYLIFGLIITSAVAASVAGGANAAGAIGFVIFLFIVLPVISILIGYLRWTRTSYAITDKRALMSTGIFSRALTDCAHNKVQNVSLRQGVFDRLFGYGHIIFATAGINSTRAADVIKAGGVFWLGVKDPVTTRRFVHEVTEYLARQQKISDYQDMARVLQASGTPMMPGAAAPGNAVSYPAAPSKCPKCGAPLTPGSRFCNSCGSQLA